MAVIGQGLRVMAVEPDLLDVDRAPGRGPGISAEFKKPHAGLFSAEAEIPQEGDILLPALDGAGV